MAGRACTGLEGPAPGGEGSLPVGRWLEYYRVNRIQCPSASSPAAMAEPPSSPRTSMNPLPSVGGCLDTPSGLGGRAARTLYDGSSPLGIRNLRTYLAGQVVSPWSSSCEDGAGLGGLGAEQLGDGPGHRRHAGLPPAMPLGPWTGLGPTAWTAGGSCRPPRSAPCSGPSPSPPVQGGLIRLWHILLLAGLPDVVGPSTCRPSRPSSGTPRAWTRGEGGGDQLHDHPDRPEGGPRPGGIGDR